MQVSKQTVDTVKATVPVLKQSGIEMVTLFYDTLFDRYPDYRAQFNLDRQRKGASKTATPSKVPAQLSALANAVLAFASNIDNISAIIPTIERICHRHVAHGVKPLQYEAIGECMIYSMTVVLKDAATPQVTAAWTDAFQYLAGTFIDTENRLRKNLTQTAGFDGFVDMRVVSNEDEESSVSNVKYRLLAVVPDDHPVPPVARGQFVAVRLTLPDGQLTTSSLNVVHNGPEDRLTIRVPYHDNERASQVLHGMTVGDAVQVSIPCGKPIILR